MAEHRMCRAGFETDHRSLGTLFQQKLRQLYKWSVCDAATTECRTHSLSLLLLFTKHKKFDGEIFCQSPQL